MESVQFAIVATGGQHNPGGQTRGAAEKCPQVQRLRAKWRVNSSQNRRTLLLWVHIRATDEVKQKMNLKKNLLVLVL